MMAYTLSLKMKKLTLQIQCVSYHKNSWTKAALIQMPAAQIP